MTLHRIGTGLAIACLAAGTLMLPSGAALAQGACESLWHQRNAIYARNGFCFRSERARAVFGPGCFPPYGELSRGEKRRVAAMQAEEDALGCPR
ncbi:YARHG domain-containing protein [Enterovirga rhinocerotis]|uniref:YARHG domain-containing protein n=1 Tax=Enterovirga rhinocerotis TaxID=1339210 RepID=A0A4R7C6H0_9HYPH|nr:YARHG domain-containing protein [Enterovirga rhinocerotis]TDR93998.1 YARHG domain-containing protein [Enterovirga rhinocerotis]